MDDNGRGDAATAVPELRFLKALVTGLALVMGLGIVALVALLWIRLDRPPLPVLPEAIVLPQGARAEAVTFARDWTVVVTEAGEVLLYDAAGGLRGRVQPQSP